MYRGFNLKIDYYDYYDYYDYLEKYFSIGKDLYSSHRGVIRDKLNSFVNYDGSLNASEMRANWFPEINADVFLSHSHKDEKMAISLAGWLYENFELETFIDSCVWGYADKLLKMIDDRYCLNPDGVTYSYKKRNYSTSHVHMMLSTALSKMIDRSECLFFLNTPNSITPKDIITDSAKTLSPWIYSEIAMTKLIRKKSPVEHRKKLLKEEQRFFSAKFNVKYDVDLSHLSDIDYEDLEVWSEKYKDVRYYCHPLDVLYDICK